MNKNILSFIFAVINLFLYLVSIGLWLSVTDETILNISVTIASLVMTIVLLLTNKASFKYFYQSKYFTQLTSYLFTAFLVAFILGLVNYLTYKNPLSIDLSPAKVNSLTKKSKAIVKSSQNVKIKVFTLASGFRQISAFLELYRLENSTLQVEMIDAEVNPVKVKEYGVTKIPTISISKGDRRKNITEISELSITNGIYQVDSGDIPEIYITQGHGELDFQGEGNEGASVLFKQLKSSNLKISFVNLSEIKSIPKTVRTLIIWGPQSSFFKEELKMIDDYLTNGGNLMLALDPQLNTDNNSILRDWLGERWGISLDNNVVIDRLKNIKGSNGTVPILAQYDKEHPITKDIKHVVFFPITSAVGLTDKAMDFHKDFKILASSMPYPAAWAEYGLGEIIAGKPIFSKNEDVEGPVGYVGALDHKDNRLLVYGNSTFVINTYQKFPKNAGFFLSGVSWLVGREEMITLDSPVLQEQPVFINQHQVGLILYLTVLFLPLVLIAIAIFFYWRKRAS